MNWKNIIKARGAENNRWGGDDWDFPIWIINDGDLLQLYDVVYNTHPETYATYTSAVTGAFSQLNLVHIYKPRDDERKVFITKERALEIEAKLKDVPQALKNNWENVIVGVEDPDQDGDIDDV